MSAHKIIDGLKDAVAGNLSRVTIEGQVWQLVDGLTPDQVAYLHELANEKRQEWAASAHSPTPAGLPGEEEIACVLCCGTRYCEAAKHAGDHGLSADGYAARMGCESKEIQEQARAVLSLIRPRIEAVERERDGAVADALHLHNEKMERVEENISLRLVNDSLTRQVAELRVALEGIARWQRDKCEQASAETLFMVLEQKIELARAALQEPKP